MIKRNTLHSVEDAIAVTTAMEALEALDAAMDAAFCFIDHNDLRMALMGPEGWRIGFLFYEDDHWQFEVVYGDEADSPED